MFLGLLIGVSACSHLGPNGDKGQEKGLSSAGEESLAPKPPPYPYARVLNKVIHEGERGLAQLAPDQRKELVAQATLYSQLRQGEASEEQREQFLVDCSDETSASPWCFLYKRSLERPTPPRRAARRAPAPAGASAVQVRRWLLGGQVESLESLSEREIRRGVASFRDLSSLKRAIDRSAQLDNCEQPFLSLAFAAKLEQFLPSPEVRELALNLYEKASNCDGGVNGVRAGYRAALFNLWVRGCPQAFPHLAKIAFHGEVPDYHTRGLYWLLSCRKDLEDQQEIIDRAHAALQTHYPLSLQNILASSWREGEIESLIRSADVEIWMRLPQEEDSRGLNAWLEAVELLDDLEQGRLAREALVEVSQRILDDEAFTEPRFRLYVAALLSTHGEHLMKFRHLAPLFRDHQYLIGESSMRLFYPSSYFESELESGEVERWGLDAFLLLSLIRQESAFQPRARSPAGARGLMQLMPRTARSFERVSLEALYDPEVNKRIGAKYLNQLLRRYDGDVELALAAYNAGPSRVTEWLRRYPTEDRMLMVDLFPFRETREYVAFISRNYFWYNTLYGEGVTRSLAQDAESAKVDQGDDGGREPTAEAKSSQSPFFFKILNM